jgi:Universal stress protein family
VSPAGNEPFDQVYIQQDREQARHLHRDVPLHEVKGDVGEAVVRLAREGRYDLIVIPLPPELPARPNEPLDGRSAYILQHAHCPVFLGSRPLVPHEVVDTQTPPV